MYLNLYKIGGHVLKHTSNVTEQSKASIINKYLAGTVCVRRIRNFPEIRYY